MTTKPRLPAWCQHLLRAIVDLQDRELVAGDLTERWPEVSARRGPRAGGRWLRREVVRAVWILGVRPRVGRAVRVVIRSGWTADARDAWRRLRSTPGLTAGIIATLSLGIGANTAVYSVLNHALLDPLPYRGGSRLAYVYSGGDSFYFVPTLRLARAWRGASSALEDLTAYGRVRAVWRDAFGTERDVSAARVEPGFFEFLGVRPDVGRALLPGDAVPSDATPAVVSRAMAARISEDPRSVPGQSIQLLRHAFSPATNETVETVFTLTVVGVMPAGFAFPGNNTDVWFPQGPLPPETIVTVLARLRPGVGAHTANAALLAAEQAAGVRPAGPGPIVRFPGDILGVSAATALWALQIAVGLVLLIGCVNVSHLLMARAHRRRAEAAVRLAIGASRGRLLRSYALEAVLLAGGAAACGLAVGAGTLDLFRAWRPDRFLTPLASTHIDIASYAAAACFSLTAVVLATVVPAWRASTADPARALGTGTRGSDGGSRRATVRMRALIVTELTLTFVVVVSAGLLGRSFTTVMRRDPGFATRNVRHLDFRFEGARYADLAERRRGLSEIVERVRALPGVSYVSFGQGLAPEGGISRDRLIAVDTGATLPDGDATLSYIGPNYFPTAGIQLAAGRSFTAEEIRDGAHVLAINLSTARRLFPEGAAIGRTVDLVTVTERRSTWTVVGVAEDTHARGLTSDAGGLQVYFPFRFELQVPTLTLAVRSEESASDPTALVSETVRSVAGEHSVGQVTTVDSLIAASLARPRFVAMLFGSLSVLALVLASVGVYGIVCYDVARRRKDVGVRLALGAGRARILGWLFGAAARPVGLGLATGVAASLAATHYLSPLLDEGSPTDPLTFALVLVVFAIVAGAAVALPARRSSRLDPLDVLRAE
jgi:predicted permease